MLPWEGLGCDFGGIRSCTACTTTCIRCIVMTCATATIITDIIKRNSHRNLRLGQGTYHAILAGTLATLLPSSILAMAI